MGFTLPETTLVSLDGFTIQDSSTSSFTGYGILLYNHGDVTIPAVDGTRIVNNIFQNNIAAIGLSNAGTTQAVIQHNLFQNNNLPGAPSGDAIYTDEYVGGPVVNVLIDANTFTGQNSAAVAFASQDPNQPGSKITVSNNKIDGCARGVYFYNTQSSTVTNNTITNSNVAPTDGGTSTAIGILGANDGITIQGNDLETGMGYGVRIGNFLAPNSNIQVHTNNIVGFELAGIQVDEAPTSPDDYATCNWWGDPSGPANPTLNPDGTGDAVVGDSLISSNFNPWLIAAAPGGQCGSTPPADGGVDGGANDAGEEDASNDAGNDAEAPSGSVQNGLNGISPEGRSFSCTAGSESSDRVNSTRWIAGILAAVTVWVRRRKKQCKISAPAGSIPAGVQAKPRERLFGGVNCPRKRARGGAPLRQVNTTGFRVAETRSPERSSGSSVRACLPAVASESRLARIIHDDSTQTCRSSCCEGRTALLEPAAYVQYASALRCGVRPSRCGLGRLQKSRHE